MKKTTFLIASIITGIFLCNIPSAQAGMLKIDAGKLAKEVVTSITNFMENFKKMMDESAAIQRAAKMGKGVMETAKQLESIKEEAEDAVNEIKEDPLNGTLNVLDEHLGDNEKFQQLQNTISDKMNDAQELLDLEEKKEKLEAKIAEQVAAKKAELEGKITVLEENNKNLKDEIEKNPSQKDEYEKQIEQNNLKIAEYQAMMSTIEGEISAEMLQELTDLNAQLDKLKASAEQYAQEQKDKVMNELKGKLSSMNSEDELKANTSKNFLAAGEVETNENILNKRFYRIQTAGNTAIEVGAKSAIIKNGLPDMGEYTKKLAARTETSDGSISTNTTDTQVSIEQIKMIAKLIELTIYDLKQSTASEMASHNGVSSAPDSNITTFSLDKYICKPQSTKEGGE